MADLVLVNARTNEPFNFVLAVNVPAAWDFPVADFTFLSQFRRRAGDIEVAVQFTSVDGSLVLAASDPVARTMQLAFLQPVAALANLSGTYVFDVLVFRNGSGTVVENGTCTFLTGISNPNDASALPGVKPGTVANPALAAHVALILALG